MVIELQSTFPLICYDWDSLFDGFDDHKKCKVSTFKNRLRRQSELNPDDWDPQTYVGNGFECFCEALIRIMGTHRDIAIYDYNLVDGSEDQGVDGYGKGWDGNPATVQAKFRSNPTKTLTPNYDHISNFVAHSYAFFDVPKNGSYKNMLIITTAKDLYWETKEKMYNKKVRTLGYRELKRMLDGNLGFWTKFKALGNEVINSTKKSN